MSNLEEMSKIPSDHINLVSQAFELLFRDHRELNDFLMEKHGIGMNLDHIREQARANITGATNEPSVWLLKFIRAMRDELDEMEESIPWKWWRGEKADLENVRVEIIDLFHFMLSAAMVSGMKADDFVRIYYRKRKLNVDRQLVGFVKGDNESLGIGRIE